MVIELNADAVGGSRQSLNLFISARKQRCPAVCLGLKAPFPVGGHFDERDFLQMFSQTNPTFTNGNNKDSNEDHGHEKCIQINQEMHYIL